MNDAGYQSLVRNALLHSDNLYLIQVFWRHANVYSLVFLQSISCILLKLLDFLLRILNRHPFSTFIWFKDIFFFIVQNQFFSFLFPHILVCSFSAGYNCFENHLFIVFKIRNKICVCINYNHSNFLSWIPFLIWMFKCVPYVNIFLGWRKTEPECLVRRHSAPALRVRRLGTAWARLFLKRARAICHSHWAESPRWTPFSCRVNGLALANNCSPPGRAGRMKLVFISANGMASKPPDLTASATPIQAASIVATIPPCTNPSWFASEASTWKSMVTVPALYHYWN